MGMLLTLSLVMRELVRGGTVVDSVAPKLGWVSAWFGLHRGRAAPRTA